MTLLEPHPTLFQVGDVQIATHGFFFALGALISTIILLWRLRGEVSAAYIVERVFWIFFTGLFLARLGFLLSYPDLWTNTSQLFRIWEGGLVSFYGMAGGLLVAWLFVRKETPEKQRAWFEALIFAGLVGWAVGRIGNYYAPDSVGVLSETWSWFYGRVPIQLFEAVLCLGLATWFVRARYKGKLRLVIAGYFVGRFFIDIWREEGVLLGLHVSQWICLVAAVVVLYPLWRRFHEK